MKPWGLEEHGGFKEQKSSNIDRESWLPEEMTLHVGRVMLPDK
jgi:hypothetical protein